MSNAMTMYNYHAWANQTLFNHLKALPRELYHQEVQSVFSSVAKAMAHIYIVDLGWMEILEGRSMSDALVFARSFLQDTEAKSIEELESLYGELAQRGKALLGRLDPEQVIVLDNPYAGVRDTSFAEMVMQIATHGAYHRGHVGAILRQLGHSSTMTDYALYWYRGAAQDAAEEAPTV